METIRLSPEMKNWRSAHTLADRFIGRWDLYAKQLPDGRYISVKEPLLGRYIIDHLKGEITLGTYVLDAESRARFTVLDADDERGRQGLTKLTVQLAKEGIPSYLEDSRRGCHLWFFYTEPIPGANARTFGHALLETAGITDIEVFPKQDRLITGPGSLIRLPFGLHQVSGMKYSFLNLRGQPLAGETHRQIRMLKRAETVDAETIHEYVSRSDRQEEQVSTPNDKTPVWTRIKQAMPVADFVGEYVELTKAASGYVGYCPFHKDTRKSFGVNVEGNFWNCFAGCGGGSIIDFYMRYKGIEFTQAVEELGDLFGVRQHSMVEIADGNSSLKNAQGACRRTTTTFVVYEANKNRKKQSE